MCYTDRVMKSVLIADDDPLFRNGLMRTFRGRGLAVTTAENARDALFLAGETRPELAVIDLFMPELCGLDLLRELRGVVPSVKVVVVSGYSSVATAVDAMRLGAAGYLAKPTTCDAILAAARSEGAPRPIGNPPRPSLARLEWEHLNRVVSECAGNMTAAARRLGIDRRTLQRKLRKHPPTR